MKVLELRDLRRREAPIHYIREYGAVAVLESFEGKAEASVAFTVEQKPLGPSEISVRVLDPVDWPLLPVMRAIRDYVADLDRQGRLP
jgi:hypothetical protein